MPAAKNASPVLQIALLTAVYYAAAKLGLSLAVVHPSATAIWPSSGIALIAVLILGYAVWPGVFLGALLVNLSPHLPGAGIALQAAAAGGIAAGNTLEAVVGAWLVRRFAQGEQTLHSAQSYLKFVALAGVLSVAVSPTVGVTSLSLSGLARWHDYGAIWSTWWLGDMGGVLIVAPLLLAWSREEYVWTRSGNLIEAGLLLASLLASAQVAFGDWPPFSTGQHPLEYLVIPPLIWAALRFGQRGATAALLLLSIAAVTCTFLGRGPFVSGHEASLTLLQAFLDTISMAIIALAADADQRKRAEKDIVRTRDQLEAQVRDRTRELAELNQALQVDISKRQQDQKRIRESHEELREYIDHMSTMSAKLAPDGSAILFNKLAQQASGMSHDELMKANFLEGAWWSFDKEIQARVKVAFAKAAAGEVISYEEKVFIFGQVIPISFSLVPVKDEKEKVVYIIAEGRDITPLKQAEEALRLKEKELLQAQKMDAVGRLAGGIAHEFNNILTGIMGLAQIIHSDLEEGHASREDAEKIVSASQNAGELVRRLLTFSRQREARKIPLSLNELISNNLKMLKAVLGERIEVETSLDPMLPATQAAWGHIEQLLMNLCLNARDAMSGSGMIRIFTRAEHLGRAKALLNGTLVPGLYAVLEVADTGCGIPEEAQSRLFEPFFTTKGIGQGSGLGLSIVYGIVKDHNGGIDLRSKRGDTLFSVYLPAAEKPSAERSHSPANEGMLGGKETLLVADDDRIVRDLLVRTFKPLGYTLLVARDGEEALQLYTRNREKIALAMLDIMMPKLKGDEVFARIAAERPQVKVLFMSGYTTAQAEHAIREQKRPFIAKPFMLDEIALKVREILDG